MLTSIQEPATVYPIGTIYQSAGKHSHTCTVVDVLRTYNSKGELVRLRYVATHDLMGRPVTDYDVVATTIARNLAR